MISEYEIKVDLVETVQPKQFSKNGKYHYYVRIYISAADSALDQIELVKYTLHPTFKDRVRVSASRQSNFDIRIWTYGYFGITATLFLKDGSNTDISGYVEWEIPEGMPFDDDK